MGEGHKLYITSPCLLSPIPDFLASNPLLEPVRGSLAENIGCDTVFLLLILRSKRMGRGSFLPRTLAGHNPIPIPCPFHPLYPTVLEVLAERNTLAGQSVAGLVWEGHSNRSQPNPIPFVFSLSQTTSRTATPVNLAGRDTL